jgi:hypothetical protein
MSTAELEVRRLSFCVWVVGYSTYLQWTYCPSDTMVLNFHCYRMVK